MQGGRTQFVSGWALALLLVACVPDEHGLTIDVRTDLVPAADFAFVQTEVSTTAFTGPSAMGNVQSHPVTATDDFVAGERIAELPELGRGDYFVRVSLLSAGATPVLRRVVRLTLVSHQSIVVVLPRSCLGVVCPSTGDAPNATECNGGACVAPTCVPGESADGCGRRQCTLDTDCAGSGECGRGRCAAGVCLAVPSDAECGGGRCQTDLRCTAAVDAAMPPPVDAAVVDGGPGCPTTETQCQNGSDDDCDGLRDCADPDCAGTSCDDGNACTYGDVCAMGAGTCAGTPVSCLSDACTDRTCNGTATCTATAHGAGTACGDDGSDCTSDVCDGAGNCTHPPLAFLTACADDGNVCTYDACDGSGHCVHPNHDGVHFGAALCCGGRVVDSSSDHDNCGVCGASCGTGSCIAGECTCFSNLECMAQGFGPQSTCYMNRCQCVCNPADSNWRGQCDGQCAGGATCDQTVGLNHCFYP